MITLVVILHCNFSKYYHWETVYKGSLHYFLQLHINLELFQQTKTLVKMSFVIPSQCSFFSLLSLPCNLKDLSKKSEEYLMFFNEGPLLCSQLLLGSLSCDVQLLPISNLNASRWTQVLQLPQHQGNHLKSNMSSPLPSIHTSKLSSKLTYISMWQTGDYLQSSHKGTYKYPSNQKEYKMTADGPIRKRRIKDAKPNS